MTRNFISVEPTASLHECAKKMAKQRVDSLLITKDKHLIGILTSRDILWAITKKPHLDMKKMRGVDIAKRKLAVIKPSTDISQAIQKMQSSNFRRLSVLSRGELIGVVTLKDILAIAPELYSEIKNITDYIREEERKLSQAGAEWPLEGLCENCGAFSDLLKVEGQLLCADCREEMY
ncbi:MAG: CBS domain-containing protein [archaeon]